ncbi:MAG: hypothetical protein JWP35_3611 [Caulobacter sp.]|jgi:hypothetical protein|nr:hypothetical protein [Caulobacter sp.]
MAKADANDEPGRAANAAQKTGDRPGLVSDKGAVETGRKEARSAGPDGPDAGKVGETFRKAP